MPESKEVETLMSLEEALDLLAPPGNLGHFT